MLKKSLLAAVVLAVIVFAMAAPAFAAPGGMPAAHGVDGKTFGGLVSDLAKSAPGAVAAHVQDAHASAPGGMGMPAAHGVDGKTFGGLVSALAHSYPGAVADHVSGK